MNKKLLAIAFFAIALIGSKALALTHYASPKGTVVLTQGNKTHDLQPVAFSVFLKNDPNKYFFVTTNVFPASDKAILPHVFLNNNYAITQSGGYNYRPTAIGDTNTPGSGWALFLDKASIVLSGPPNKITVSTQVTKNNNCTELQCKFTCFVPNERNSSILGDRGIFTYIPGFNNNVFTLSDTFSNLTVGKTYACYASCICANDVGLAWQHGEISYLTIGPPAPPPPPPPPPKYPFYYCNIAQQDCPPIGQFENETLCETATGKDCYPLANLQQCKDACKVAPCGNGKIDPGEQCDPNETEADFKTRTGKDSFAWADMKLRCDPATCLLKDLKTCKIGVFGGHYEEMENILKKFGLNFDFYKHDNPIQNVNLSQYDAILLDCFAADPFGAQNAIEKYVKDGGKLYISDFNLPILEKFPEITPMDWTVDALIDPGTYKIDIVDPEMKAFMGTSNANLWFDTIAQYLYPKNAKTLLYSPDIQKTIAVSFNHGQGSVVYSSFHMTVQNDDIAQKMTYYYLYKVLSACK